MTAEVAILSLDKIYFFLEKKIYNIYIVNIYNYILYIIYNLHMLYI